MSRRRFLTTAAGAAAGLAVGGPTLWVPPARAAVAPGGVHLGFGADPASTMTVSWSTPAAVANPCVEIGLDDGYGRRVPADGNGAPGVADHFHHASIDQLSPGTTYHYRVSHDGGDPVTGTFSTAPDRPRSFRFATFGDMGVSAGAAANVATLVAADPAFCFVVGDLCYADLSGGGTGLLGVSAIGSTQQDPTIWDQWLAQVQPSASARPWMATVGNHEMEQIGGELGYDGYLARFRPPAAGPSAVTYSFRYGNVGFVACDGNDASTEITRNNGYLGATQDAWLDETLAALRSDPTIEFVVVGFHNCMYCTNLMHGSDGGVRGRWEPLFDAHGVDLVVNGHNHCYERTHQVRAGEVVDQGGTTYLTVGGGGQMEYPTSTFPASYVVTEGGSKEPEVGLWSAVRFMHHSLAIVDVEAGAMHVRAVDSGGAPVDSFTLLPRRAA
jgi:hypothetical protein